MKTTVCNACHGLADADGYCLERCGDDGDTRCVDCVLSECHGPEGGEDCPCNYECHDIDDARGVPTLPMIPAVKAAVRTVRA